MGNYPVLKAREVAALLEGLGFVEVRQRGSHKQYRHPESSPTHTHGKEHLRAGEAEIVTEQVQRKRAG